MTFIRPVLLPSLSVALVAVLALSGCAATKRSAEGPVNVLGPAEVTAGSAAGAPLQPGADPAPASVDAPVGLGAGRGVDLCIFNKRAQPFTVAFSGNPGTQGAPQVAPGDWYCGYDFSDAVVQGRITGLPGEEALVYAENPGISWPNISVDLMQGDNVRFCGIRNGFNPGESDVTDSGDVRYVFGRNQDDNSWKYLYIEVLPSQGATPECVGKKSR